MDTEAYSTIAIRHCTRAIQSSLYRQRTPRTQNCRGTIREIYRVKVTILFYRDEPARLLLNSATVNKNIAEWDQAASTERKVLEMQWKDIGDTITLRCTEKQANKASKRTVLSQINGYCYDPLDLLSPLMVAAKILLQDLYKQKCGLDDVLSERNQNI
ncbi:hypothetical protein V3C99_017996 [Haemonchus contortus]|uniref:Ig-like domain-containing protein n=1 Tax=Haemonchus contortus TaxID=6289 RepID=A0A7I4Z423_HAECO